MAKDYRFEILKTFHESESGKVDLRPLIMHLIQSGQVERLYLRDTLRDMKDADFISVGDLRSLWVQQYNAYDDEVPISARLEHKGIEEYFRLKNLYSPTPPRNVIQVGGNFTGNLSQGNHGPVKQSTNDGFNVKHFLFSIVNNKIDKYRGTISVTPADYNLYETSFGVEEIYYKAENSLIVNVICDAFNEESASKAVTQFLSELDYQHDK
jgi:hypothetical protein